MMNMAGITTLGLRRNTVQIVEHELEWAAAFALEASRISSLVGNDIVDVQHVGSTAIAGLPAKPILDIAVAIRAREALPALTEHLRQQGYIDRGDAGAEGGYLLVKESEPGVRTVHVHIVEAADDQWRNYIEFRESLRSNPNLCRRYTELKRRLAERCRDDRKSYTEGKAAFIRAVLSRRHE